MSCEVFQWARALEIKNILLIRKMVNRAITSSGPTNRTLLTYF